MPKGKSRIMKTKEWGINATDLRKSIKRALKHPKLSNVTLKSVRLNKSLTKKKGKGGLAKVYDVKYTIWDKVPKRRK